MLAHKLVQMAERLRWPSMHLLLSHFQDSIAFGEYEELRDLLRLHSITPAQARALFEAGYTTLQHLAHAPSSRVMKAMRQAVDWTAYDLSTVADVEVRYDHVLPCTLQDAEAVIRAARKCQLKRHNRVPSRQCNAIEGRPHAFDKENIPH